ncbi:MAG: Holliday junction resolvase RuvX [Deltaproteobacteria bacterium]|nr:Holliday junction resolvase RuvX [Deltaproteobacteria bacterium]
MKILALDVGHKRIGMAKTDGLGIGVWPLQTLQRRSLSQDLEGIFEILESDQVEKIVVGLPLSMNGSESPQTQKTRTFANQLKRYLHEKGHPLPVDYWDERLSSWEAEETLSQAGIKTKKNKGLLDAEAACVILRDYLSINGFSPS